MPTTFAAVRALRRSGVLDPVRPDRALRMGLAVRRGGFSGSLTALAAIRHGDRTALVDERGALTFAELHARSNGVANAWRAAGLRPGDGVAVLCANGRAFVDALHAAGKLGLSGVFMNTHFAAPQVGDVLAREGVRAVVHDEGLAPLLERARRDVLRIGAAELEEAARHGDRGDPPRAGRDARVVLLTSGTTGTPKRAPREASGSAASLVTAGALLDRFPFRAREATMLPAPMFHAWGFAHALLAFSLGSKLVVRRRFDAEETLRLTAQHGCTALMAVPVMMQRILDLGEEVLGRYDLRALRMIGLGGSALPGGLATRIMDRFGDIAYNLYGSTEVSVATIATPEDLRAAPGCAGRPVLGTQVRLYDEAGRPVTGAGARGRIFVRGELPFEGYTGGGTKEVVDGLMSTGDLGHFDAAGRLHVEGRDDDMIVSGGENVFPQEIEEAILTLPAVAEAAVAGVADADFGERLCAWVVRAPGAALDAEAVQAHVRAELARFKVPREVRFVDELPRNALGKVLRRELAAS